MFSFWGATSSDKHTTTERSEENSTVGGGDGSVAAASAAQKQQQQQYDAANTTTTSQPIVRGGESLVRYVSFNQSSTLFAVATLKGYHVFGMNPLREHARMYFPPIPPSSSSTSSTDTAAATNDQDQQTNNNNNTTAATATTSGGGGGVEDDTVGDVHRNDNDDVDDHGTNNGNAAAAGGGGGDGGGHHDKNGAVSGGFINSVNSMHLPYSAHHEGVGLIEMLFSSNIVALVGGGSNPIFQTRNKVFLWDDHQKQHFAEIACPRPVRAVRLNKNMIIVAQEDKILVYDQELRQVNRFQSAHNPRGICALSPDSDNTVLAFPASAQKGMIHVELFATHRSLDIRAHEGDIACVALSRDGTRLATASEKGTLLRVFDTNTGVKIKEVRRGTTRAEIHSIAISSDNNYMCCTSSTGTVHLFYIGAGSSAGTGGTADSAAAADSAAVAPPSEHQQQLGVDASQRQQQPVASNRKSTLSVLSYVGMDFNIASSEWSLAEYKSVSSPSICCFGADASQVRVVTYTGELIELTFDLRTGGDATRVKRSSFRNKLTDDSPTLQPKR